MGARRLGLLNLQRNNVRLSWIKDLACPKQRHQVARTHVLDRVGVARRDVQDLEILASHGILDDLTALDVSKANHGFTLQDQELLSFRVVVMVAAGDPRLRARDEDLEISGHPPGRVVQERSSHCRGKQRRAPGHAERGYGSLSRLFL